jgi:chromosome partitioning protein
VTTPVTAKLGWPGSHSAGAPGLGWPDVSRETPPHSDETPQTADIAELEAPQAEANPTEATQREASQPEAAPSGQQPSRPDDVTGEEARSDLAAEAGPDVDPRSLDEPQEPRHRGVPRETSPALSPGRVITAAQVADGTHPDPNDAAPTARAVEHSLAVAARRPVRRALPKPEQTRVLVVANQKGGVGKTTTAVNVAAAVAQHGLRVLLVDLDPQGNASTALSVEHSEGTPDAYDVLVQSTPIREVVAECPEVPGLFVLPATIDLAGAEIELVSMVARETRMRRALDRHLVEAEAAGQRYDYVLIDCPPSLGLLTVNALAAGRELLIPIQCEYYALEGLTQLLRTIDSIKEHLNPDLRVGAIVLTMYDARTRLAAGVAEEVRQHFGDLVLPTAIPRSVRISEAPSYGQTVLTYDPGSTGALSYLELAYELTHQSEVTS